MAKASRLRTISPARENPASLNESTLETNIAAEIVGLFNSPFNWVFNSRLHRLFRFPRVFNPGSFKKRKTKIYRLTPIEENRGGGWDTKLIIPTGSNEERAIFIQFKSGVHSNGNNITKSLFNISIKDPNPNAEFTFNDNSNNNQHATLTRLANELNGRGISRDTVMYGFPRITTLKAFEELEDDLLLHTSFLTIPEIENESKLAKVNLNDGMIHHFRTCYIQENRREISSEVFRLKGEDKNIENLLSEIILVKLSHLRNQLREEYSYPYLNDELFLLLATYLKINPKDFVDYDRFFFNSSSEINNYFERMVLYRNRNFSKIYGESDSNSLPFEWRERLFKKVVKFFENIQNEKIDIVNDIPSKFTFNLSQEERKEFEIEGELNTNLIIF